MRNTLSFLLFFSLALIADTARAMQSDLAISFFSPTNGQTITAPWLLRVNTGGTTNTVVSVEYFAGTNSIGIATNGPIIFTPMSNQSVIYLPIVYTPFMLDWNPAPADYVLTAKATDDQGNTAFSDPINVTVVPLPVVTVQSTEPIASPGHAGVFTISRTGSTNTDLQVICYLNGTAVNGVDYATVSNSITIPAGQSSTDIVINPLQFSKNGKAVTLSLGLFPLPLAPTAGTSPVLFYPFDPPYGVGFPFQATVYINANQHDRHTPSVKLTEPTAGERFPSGSTISLIGSAADRDTYVARVEFFDGTAKIGEAPYTFTPSPGLRASFYFNWTNAPVGPHMVRARAVDSQNRKEISAPVRILVLPSP